MELLYVATYVAILCIGNVSSDILVYTTFSNQLIEEFRDLPAKFGRQLPPNGLKVHGFPGNPANGCTPLEPPPQTPDTEDFKWAVLIARYNCTFEEKVRNAQLSGYDVAIVYNLDSNELEQMSAKSDDGITIPSVFVGETTAKILMINYQYQDGFVLLINDELPFNINTHLILPFSIVVGLCFIIMIGFMIVKCVREQRRLRRHRLPRSVLKTIPTIKFNKGHPYEVCVICLDEYVEGDKLRVLPCQHAYHCKCIDQWLTKNRRFCPICKRKVLPRRQPRQRRSSDSTSDSEPDATDSTPLINPVDHGNSHGTFNQSNNEDGVPSHGSRVNPFDRTPNLPPNLSLNQDENPTLWSRIRMFRWPRILTRNSNEDVESQIDDADTVAVAIPSQTSSSNNILNSNLSGSFRDSDDDEQLMERNIYEPTTTTTTTAEQQQNQPHQSIAEPSSSASTSTQRQQRLGVAAIPNTQFCPTTPLSSRSNRGRESADDDFAV